MGAFPAETAPACAQEPLLAGAEASRRVRRGHAGPSRVGISSMVLSRGRTPPPPNVGGIPGWTALPPGAPGPVSTARGPHHPGSHTGPRPGRPPPFSHPASLGCADSPACSWLHGPHAAAPPAGLAPAFQGGPGEGRREGASWRRRPLSAAGPPCALCRSRSGGRRPGGP